MKHEPIYDILKEIYLFSCLSEDELQELTKICSIHHYKKESLLFMAGEKSDSLLVLTQGIVSIHKHDNKGNKIVIGFFKPFSLLAEAAILKRIPFPSTAMFRTEGSVIKINLAAFEKNFLKNSHISYEIIQSLLNKIQLLQQNIHFNIASSAKEKILHFYKQNPSLGLELKQYEIAALLGITAETFSRNIKQLLKEKKLQKSANSYKVT